MKETRQQGAAETLLGLRRGLKTGDLDAVYLFHMKQAERDRETVEFLITGLVEAILAQFRKDPAAKFNIDAFEGSEAGMAQVLASARTMPMFGQRRLTIYRNTTGVKDDDVEKIVGYLKDPMPVTTLVLAFMSSKVPEKLLRTAGSLGWAHRIEKIPDRSLEKWITGVFREEGAKIAPEAVAVIAEHSGGNLQAIEDAKDKLVLYTLGRDRIEASDVEQLLLSSRSADIYELADALWDKNAARALRVLAQLESQKTEPLFINTILVQQVRSLIKIKAITSGGRRMSSADVASMLGMQEFVARMQMARAKKYSLREFEEALALCVEMNALLKSSRMPSYLIIEQSAMKIMSLHV
jgi:DNA polymerase-3 subunit delta